MVEFLFLRVIILLIVSILCDTAPYTCDKNTVPCGCGRTTVGINARIVNGENSIPDSWPMMVSLRKGHAPLVHSCGGTILSESYILTAAHCANDITTGITVENMTIAAGVYNLSQSDQIIRQVDKIIIHPLWKELRREIQYDIAILHLAEPLDLTPNSSISRTCLPPRQNSREEIMQYPLNGTKLVTIGWGSLETFGMDPDILQQVTVSSIHHFDKICANTIRDPSIQFCAGLYQGGKGSCYGDSGGPIFQWIGDRWEQVGIVSYGENGCATEGYPAVYTRISYFYDWIQSHILGNNQTVDSRVLYNCLPTTNQCGCSRRSVVLPSSTMTTSEDALPYSWSMVVSIRVGSSDQHICSGTILEDSYILTAAHCLTNRSAQDITIEAGMYYQSESNVSIRQVDQIYIHPNYTVHSNVYKNDIAILHLSFPLDASDDKKIARTCLPTINNQWLEEIERPSNGTRLVVTGWHIMNMSRPNKPQILQQTKIYAVYGENSKCSVSEDQRQLQFCAESYKNDKDMCYGDVFGDPIFQWIDSHWVQLGLASYCRMSDKLDVFTNLAAYSGWIKSISNPPVIQSSNIYQCDKKAPCGCGQTDVNITVSGVISSDDVVEHSWPMIVSIRLFDTHLCTGSILSDSFILTSARYADFFNEIDALTIIVGIPGTVQVLRKVDKVYIHPNYSYFGSNSHDIAIIHLDQPLTLDNRSSTYTKTCVPNESKLPTDNYPKPNSLLAVIGFDRIESDDRILYMLQQISVTVLESEHQLCPRSNFNNTYQFCAKPSNNNSKKISYLCDGSLGGPVMIYKNNHWEQIGIIPGTFSCWSTDQAKAYIRLSPFLAWIKNVTNSSFTTYPSLPEWIENVTNSSLTTSTTSNNSSGITNQRQNNLIFGIFCLLIIILL